MPPTVPINHYFSSRTNKIEPKSYLIIPCCSIQGKSLLETLCFSQSKSLGNTNQPIKEGELPRKCWGKPGYTKVYRPNPAEIQLRAF